MSPRRIFVIDCEGLQSKESCIVISLKERVRGDSRYMSQRMVVRYGGCLLHLLVLTPVCSSSALGLEFCGALLSHPALSFFRRRCSSRPSAGKHAIALKALLAG